jgi:hypothetical protein
MSTPNLIPNKAAERYGKEWAAELRNQLRIAGKDATGRLIKSIRSEALVQGQDVEILVEAESYLEYVDAGRRPGGKRVPISALQQWINIKGIQPRAGMTVDALPWVIQNSIWRKGIPATNVIPKTISAMQTNTRAIALLEQAIAENIENQTESQLS